MIKVKVKERNAAIRLEFDVNGFSDCLPLKGFFNFWENIVVPAMQVNQRLTALINDFSVSIRDMVIKGDDGIFGNLRIHGYFPSVGLAKPSFDHGWV